MLFTPAKIIDFFLPRPFEASEEALYRARQNERALSGTRALLLFVAIGILLFAGWDYYIDPTSLPYTVPIRVLASILSVVLWGSTYCGTFRKRLTLVLSIESVATALTISWILRVVSDGLLYGLAGLSYIPLALLAIADTRFVAVNCFILLAIVNLFAYFDEVPQIVLVNANFFLAAMCTLTYVFSRFSEARDRHIFQLQRELEQRANIDGLTSALNHRHFLETAQNEIARARRYNEPLALLMMDADRFKRINDTYGHAIGDVALRSFSQTCRNALRNIDSFGRIGGEEFAVLLPQTSAQAALEIAERLRHQLDQMEVSLETTTAKTLLPENARRKSTRGTATKTSASGAKIPVITLTASIGVAIFQRGDTLESLLERADIALYVAKTNGRNQVVSSEKIDSTNVDTTNNNTTSDEETTNVGTTLFGSTIANASATLR